jgi:hypothetical protein
MKVNITYVKLIETILTNDAESRDDWMLCVKKIHSWQMMLNGVTKEQYFDKLFEQDADEKYSYFMNVDTIKRIWAKVQEEKPSLRGLKWVERQIQGGNYNVNVYNEMQLSLFSEEQLNKLTNFDFKAEL